MLWNNGIVLSRDRPMHTRDAILLAEQARNLYA